MPHTFRVLRRAVVGASSPMILALECHEAVNRLQRLGIGRHDAHLSSGRQLAEGARDPVRLRRHYAGTRDLLRVYEGGCEEVT
jgi:hypothetical protein